MTKSDLIELLAVEVRWAGSPAAWARKHSVSPSYVTFVLQGDKEPGPKILAALKVERVVTYQRVP